MWICFYFFLIFVQCQNLPAIARKLYHRYISVADSYVLLSILRHARIVWYVISISCIVIVCVWMDLDRWWNENKHIHQIRNWDEQKHHIMEISQRKNHNKIKTENKTKCVLSRLQTECVYYAGNLFRLQHTTQYTVHTHECLSRS